MIDEFLIEQIQSEKFVDKLNRETSWMPAFMMLDRKHSEVLTNVKVEDVLGLIASEYLCSIAQDGKTMAVEYTVTLDGVHCGLHRVGGPAKYIYDYDKRIVRNVEWYIFGRKMTAYEYWDRITNQLQNVYYAKDIANHNSKNYVGFATWKIIAPVSKTIDSKGLEYPHPDRMFEATDRLQWKINGEIVSLGKYWALHEQMFTVLPKKAHYTKESK